MKKLPKKLVWTLGVILGLVLVVVVGVRLFFPADKVKEMAVDLASEKLGREVTVAEAGVSLSGGLGVRLKGVAVANPPGFSGAPMFAAEEIDLKLELRPLLQREFQVKRLVVGRPRVRLVRLAGGGDNFTFEAAADEERAPVANDPATPASVNDTAVRFDRLEIHAGRLLFRDEETGQQVELAGIDWTGNLANPTAGRFQSRGLASVDSLIVSGAGPVPVLPVVLDYELSFDATDKLLELTRGDWKIDSLPVDCTGRMSLVPESLRISGSARATGLSLTDFLAYVPAEQQSRLEDFTITGTADAQAEFEFDQARPEPVTYSGEVLVKDLAAVAADVEGELSVSRTRVVFDTASAQVTTEGGSFADQPLALELNVREFENPVFSGRLAGEVDLVFAGPFLPAEKGISLTGRCALEGTFEGRADAVEDLVYDARAEFRDVFYADNVLPDTLHSLNGSARFGPDEVTVEKMEAIFGAGDLTVTGRMTGHLPYFLPAEKENRASLPRPEISFTATSRRIDIDKLFPAASPGAAADGAPSAAPLPDSVATAAVPDILAAGTIAADTLIYSEVPFTGVTGKLRLADRVLTCTDVSASVYGGTAAGNVAIDLGDLNDPGYSGTYEARQIEADNFVSRFVGRSGVLFGKAGLAGSFQARGKDPERIKRTLTLDSEATMVSGKVVTGQFVGSTLGDLAAKAGRDFQPEQGLKDLSTLIKVENGRVGLNDLKTRLGNLGDLTLGGSYGFDGSLEYDGALLLTREQTESLYATGGLAGSVANLFGNQAERLRLPLTVGGTMTSPRMDIDYSELTDNLRSQVNDSLKDELNDKLKGLFGK
jgi:uncharacterized protein involved in outer membrane biogenesis